MIPFAPIHFPTFLTNWYVVIIGLLLFITGLVLAMRAFTLKEKELMKYLSLTFIILGVIFIYFLTSVVGSV